MPLRRPALFVAAALAVVALGAPAAGAGSNDAQAIRTVAARYMVATTSGSPVACHLLTPAAQKGFISLASMLTKTKLSDCPAAVKAIAKLNESQFPSHAAYLRSDDSTLRAIAHAKVTVHGAHATLDYTAVTGFVHASSSLEFALVQGHWLING